MRKLHWWIARYRQRNALREMADMNDERLNDIGISKQAARREADKFFWQ